MHPDEAGDRTAEAFDNFCVLHKGGIVNGMLEFVIFVNPPIKDMFNRTWSTPSITTNTEALSRIVMLLGPNKEVVFKIWQVKRYSLKGRLRSFYMKPIAVVAFAIWFVSDLLGFN